MHAYHNNNIFFIYIFILLRLIVIFQTSHNTHTHKSCLKQKYLPYSPVFRCQHEERRLLKYIFFSYLLLNVEEEEEKNFPNYKIVLYVSIAPFTRVCVYTEVFFLPISLIFFFYFYLQAPRSPSNDPFYYHGIYIAKEKATKKKRLVFCIVINKRKT